MQVVTRFKVYCGNNCGRSGYSDCLVKLLGKRMNVMFLEEVPPPNFRWDGDDIWCCWCLAERDGAVYKPKSRLKYWWRRLTARFVNESTE